MLLVAFVVAFLSTKRGKAIKTILVSPLLFSIHILQIRLFKYQAQVLEAASKRRIIVAGRQVGKTYMLALFALWWAFTRPDQTVLIIAPTLRQSKIVYDRLRNIASAVPFVSDHRIKDTLTETSFAVDDKPSSIYCLPAGRTGEFLRGYPANLVIMDEAAFIPDRVFTAVRPAVAAVGGTIILSGTPFGENGFFYETWVGENDKKHEEYRWRKFKIPSIFSPLISKEFLEDERESGTMTEAEYQMEYEAEFISEADEFFPKHLIKKVLRDYLYWIVEPKDRRGILDEKLLIRWDIKSIMPGDRIIGLDVARHGCFDEEMEILTGGGWKYFKDVMDNEEVLTMDPETREAHFEKIYRSVRYPYYGDLITFEGENCEFSVTPCHKFIRFTPGGHEWIHASDLLTHRYYHSWFVRDFKWAGEEPEDIGFVNHVHLPNGGYRSHKWNFDTGDFFEFVGWFVSEGSIFTDKIGRSRINIAQREGPKKDELRRLLDKMGLTYSDKWDRVEISNNKISEWLVEHCGKGAPNKKAPDIIKSATPLSIKRFLQGYRLGDGWTCPNGGAGYCTTSPQLANDVQELVFKSGGVARITKRDKKGSVVWIEGHRAERRHDIYEIYQFKADGKIHLDNVTKKIKLTPYEGYVYDVEVRPHHTILVRKNGKVFWSGNTDETAAVTVERLKDKTLATVKRRTKLYKVVWSGTKRKMSVPESADWGRYLMEIFQAKAIVVDETGVGGGAFDLLKADFGTQAEGVTFSSQIREAMYNTLKIAMERENVILSLDDKKMFRQFGGYKLKKTEMATGKMQIKKTTTGHDDLVDALALAIWGYEYGRKMTPLDVILPGDETDEERDTTPLTEELRHYKRLAKLEQELVEEMNLSSEEKEEREKKRKQDEGEWGIIEPMD